MRAVEAGAGGPKPHIDRISMPAEVPHLFTPSQVAERLAVSRSAVYAWVRAGRLRALYLGRLPRFTEADVLEFIASQQQRDVAP